MVNAGQAYAAQGYYTRAEAMFMAALKQNPGNAAAANQMGQLLVRRRQDNAAKAWFERAIASQRDYAPAVSNLGGLYIRVGQFTDAIAAFLYGIGIAPSDEAFYLNLAIAYSGLGDRDAARESIGRLFAREPQNVRGKQTLHELERQ